MNYHFLRVVANHSGDCGTDVRISSMLVKWPWSRKRHRSRDPRWPILAALATAWSLPATTTRRVVNPTARDVIRYHAVVLLLAALLLLIVRQFHRYSVHGEWGNPIFDAFDELADMVLNLPVGFAPKALWVATAVGLIEATLAVLALVAVPFAARNEPWPDSWRHAFTRVWLQSSQVFPAMILVAAVLIVGWMLEARWPRHVDQQYERLRPTPALITVRVNGEGANLAAQQALKVQRAEEHDAFVAWKPKPWYVVHAVEFRQYSCALVGVWFLWALARALCARRPFVPQEQKPRCRWCGYMLVGVADESVCPECAQPVAESVGVESCPGAPWDRRRTPVSYVATLLGFLARPLRSARRLRLGPDPARTVRFLAYTLAVCAAVFAISYSQFVDARHASVLGVPLRAPLAGLIAAGIVFLVICVAVHLAGLSMQLREGRNLYSAVAQVGVYCSGFLVLATIGASLLLARWPYVLWRLDALSASTGWTVGYVTVLAAAIAFLVLQLGYFLIVSRAARGIRYAYR